ncbi:hypothetical protein SCHPADRAFT_927413 [Schizopora paradoxa]|uniref:DUF6533 domain-containing protein n=1 Tax=Schizopora paradoxa TaxID=27342 RepID=A0A0H2RSZ5_9AGAM|nr:hypothetical protein SCHPADRAFT_927413 [Schizopora paradoxa]
MVPKMFGVQTSVYKCLEGMVLARIRARSLHFHLLCHFLMSFIVIPTRSNQYYLLASSVVFFYDYALTLPQEYKHVWSKGFSTINALLIGLRYISIIGYLPTVALGFSPSLQKNSTWFVKIPAGIGIVTQCLVIAFLIIRLYAIFEKQHAVMYVMIPFALLSICLSMSVMAQASTLIVNEFSFSPGIISSTRLISASCLMIPDSNSSASLLRYEASYIATITFDTFVFLLSLAKIRHICHTTRWRDVRPTLAVIMLRDGFLLFAVLATSNVIHLALYLRFWDRSANDFLIAAPRYAFVVSSGTNNEMTHALSVILISRMVFNLREAGTEVYEGTIEWRSRVEQSIRRMEFNPPSAVDGPDESFE